MPDLQRRLGIAASSGTVPTVSLNTGSGAGLLSIGQAYFSLAAQEKQREAIADEIEGKKAGAQAALSQALTLPDGTVLPRFMEAEGTDVYTRAYNREQMVTYRALLEKNIREKAAVLSVQHRSDPQAMVTEFDSYIQGLVSSAPVQAQALIASQASALITPRVLDAFDQRRNIVARENEAARESFREQLLQDAYGFGQSVGLQGSGASGAAGNIGSLLTSYIDVTANQVDGETYTAAEAQRDVQVFTSAVTRQTIMGMYDGAADKDGFATKFVEGNASIDIPVMTPDGVKVVRQNARAAMSEQDRLAVQGYFNGQQRERARIERKAESDFDRARTERGNAAFKDAVTLNAEGNLTDEFVEANRDEFTTAQFATLKKLADPEQAIENDPELFADIMEMMEEDPMQARDMALTGYRQGQLTQQFVTMVEARGAGRTPQSLKQGLDFIAGKMAPSPLFDEPGRKSRMVEAKDALRRFYLADPTVSDADIFKRARELVQNLSLAPLENEFGLLADPTYMSIRRDVSDLAGIRDDLRRAELDFRRRLDEGTIDADSTLARRELMIFDAWHDWLALRDKLQVSGR
ncbi:MAG: hypothetical protein QNJ94_18575 [Alphaproteobacteria bacterium]|nr:hypothetical protein [Alphaproteobacteria bacterium]